MIAFWILIFILSLGIMIKSADWFIENSEKIALAFKISPFIIGVTIVALGTSLPELASSLVAVFKNTTEIVPANVLGSNITNILLIVGLSAIAARTLIIKRSLIDLDAPLLGASTFLLVFVMWDGKIVFGEGVLLILGFLIYLSYTVFHRREEDEAFEAEEVLPSRAERRREGLRLNEVESENLVEPKISFKNILFLIFGAAGLAFGANYTVESILKLSSFLGISTSLLAITIVALGTSLPELVVSVGAARKKKYEIALGNIFGSNFFNVLIVAGIPSLIKTLEVDELTLSIGLPFLVIATLLFIISGISRRIHIWEGAMYLLLYVLFIVKICQFF